MNNQLKVGALTLYLILKSLCAMSHFSGSGSGTKMNPYIIVNAAQLNEIRERLSAHYQLGANIDLKNATSEMGGAYFNSGAGWQPIGGNSTPFTGTLKGKGFRISGLTISRPSEDDIGLFRTLGTGALIDSLSLIDVTIVGKNNVGALVGKSYIFIGSGGNTISHIRATGNIQGNSFIGGITGIIGSGSVSDLCRIDQCVTECTISGANYLGGIAALITNAEIRNSYSLSTLTGNSTIGGITNFSNNTNQLSKIYHCYAAGNINASTVNSVGGIVGNEGIQDNVEVLSSYWDVQTTAYYFSPYGRRRTHEMMLQESRFSNWNFSTIWEIDEGNTYPYLRQNSTIEKPIIHLTSVLPFANGLGYGDDPWEIETIDQFSNISDFSEDTFILKNDLDFSLATGDESGNNWNEGKGWKPISNFSGVLLGQGHTIDGLFINRSNENYIGLFAFPTGPTIKNLHLTNVDILGAQYVAGIAGWLNGSEVKQGLVYQCSVQGSIKGVEIVGGLIGNNLYGNILECFAAGTVIATLNSAGGLTGNHTGASDFGILNSYSAANVEAGDNAGLLTGQITSTKVTNSYSVGKLVGPSSSNPIIGSTSNAVVKDSFWYEEINCRTDGTSFHELMETETYPNWDFESIWSIVENQTYPYLKWQDEILSQNTPIDLSPTPTKSILPILNSECFVEAPSTLPTATSNCGDLLEGQSNVDFPIIAVGETIITWSFEDEFGFESTQTQTVNISEDTKAPIPDIEFLEALQSECEITADPPTATDNCLGEIVGTTDVEFPITSQGTTLITWTYADGNGNISSQNQEITLVDNTAPLADADTLLPFVGSCIITQLSPPTATDNCDGSITGTTETTFPITHVDTIIISWTFTDSKGNASTQLQEIILKDELAPIPDATTLPDIISECNGTIDQLTYPTATDECVGTITGTTEVKLPITSPGITEIVWHFDDGHGNISFQSQNIIILHTETIQVDTAVCFGELFVYPDGTSSRISGQNTSRLTSSLGCDSVINTTLTILPPLSVDIGSDTIKACEGELLAFGFDQTKSNYANYTISYFGDSVDNDSLMFTFDSSLDNFNVIATARSNEGCIGHDTVIIKDNILSGITQNFPTFSDPSIGFSIASLPDNAGDWYWDFGDGTTSKAKNPVHSYTTNGTYKACLIATNECDSIMDCTTINITSNCTISDISVVATENTIEANASGFSYQWINCNTNQLIAGADNQSFTPDKGGNFAVKISDGNCTLQSECITIEKEAVLNTFGPEHIKFYPNPIRNKLNISNELHDQLQVTLFTASGKIILSERVTYELSTLDLSAIPSGIYLIRVQSQKVDFQKKIVVAH